MASLGASREGGQANIHLALAHIHIAMTAVVHASMVHVH